MHLSIVLDQILKQYEMIIVDQFYKMKLRCSNSAKTLMILQISLQRDFILDFFS